MAGAQSGDDDALLRFGRRRLFKDVINFVEHLGASDEPSSDGAVKREFALVRGLHG